MDEKKKKNETEQKYVYKNSLKNEKNHYVCLNNDTLWCVSKHTIFIVKYSHWD